MIIESFAIAPPLIGGALIGLAAVSLMAINGRIAGISGIFGGTLFMRSGDSFWRIAFVLGLMVGVAMAVYALGVPAPITQNASKLLVIAGGALVGIGTALGAGCTSGHGVCGIARGSGRSIAATLTFMATGAVTVYLLKHVFA